MIIVSYKNSDNVTLNFPFVLFDILFDALSDPVSDVLSCTINLTLLVQIWNLVLVHVAHPESVGEGLSVHVYLQLQKCFVLPHLFVYYLPHHVLVVLLALLHVVLT